MLYKMKLGDNLPEMSEKKPFKKKLGKSYRIWAKISFTYKTTEKLTWYKRKYALQKETWGKLPEMSENMLYKMKLGKSYQRWAKKCFLYKMKLGKSY